MWWWYDWASSLARLGLLAWMAGAVVEAEARHCEGFRCRPVQTLAVQGLALYHAAEQRQRWLAVHVAKAHACRQGSQQHQKAIQGRQEAFLVRKVRRSIARLTSGWKKHVHWTLHAQCLHLEGDRQTTKQTRQTHRGTVDG